MKEERNKTLHWMNQISYYDPSYYIGAQLDLTQVTTRIKKSPGLRNFVLEVNCELW